MSGSGTTDNSTKGPESDQTNERIHEAPSEMGDQEDSMSQQGSVIIHSTPEKGFDTSYEDLSPPLPADLPKTAVLGDVETSLPDSPATPQSVSSYEPESSFEIVNEGQSPSWISSGPSSRIVSSSSAGASSTSSFFSQPKPTKVTITAPSNRDHQTPTKVVHSRSYSGITPRHPSTRAQSSSQEQKTAIASDADSSLPHDSRSRSSSKLQSSRLSLSPILSPIPDVLSNDGEEASETTRPNTRGQRFDENFPGDATFAYIVEYGKNEIGDLGKSARKALAKLGLKSIPSMHGPLSLPYARCPSGIDAFLFSIEKEEDPWTFLLEDDKPRRGPQRFTQGGFRINSVPLPGNSRYSQLSQTITRGPRGPAGGAPRHDRRVSSSAKSWSKSALFAGSKALESEIDAATPTTASFDPSPAVQPAQFGAHHAYPQAYDPYGAPHYALPPPAQPTRGSTPFQQPPHAVSLQPPYVPPSPYWPHAAFPFPTAAEFMQSVYQQRAASPYSRPQSSYSHAEQHPQAPVQTRAPASNPPSPAAPYGYPPPSHSRAPLLDPAIVAYGQRQQEQQQQQQQQHRQSRGDESIYYTAPSEAGSSQHSSASEETQHGGFFFPATRPQDYDQYSTRRRSVSASGRTPPPAPRRPSIELPPVDARASERRNSAAPHSGQRRMSLAPPVTVMPRRSSVAAQTRLVKDSYHTHAYGSGELPAPMPPQHLHGGAQAVRQPRAPSAQTPTSPPRIPLVPNHARVVVTDPSPRKNSRARADISTFTAAAKDAGIGVRRGSNASAGGWGVARDSDFDQGWSPQSDSVRSKKRGPRGRGRRRGTSVA